MLAVDQAGLTNQREADIVAISAKAERLSSVAKPSFGPVAYDAAKALAATLSPYYAPGKPRVIPQLT